MGGLFAKGWSLEGEGGLKSVEGFEINGECLWRILEGRVICLLFLHGGLSRSWLQEWILEAKLETPGMNLESLRTCP